MYSVVMVVAMAGAPEAPACCPSFHCPKLCLPTIHCPTFHCPKLCCKPACPTTTCCAPVAAPAPMPVPPPPAPVAAPCAPTCAPACAPSHHGCCFLSKCFSCFSCGKHGGGWGGEPVYAGPVAPGCGQVVIPPAPGTVVPPTTTTPQTVPVDPKKAMPKTGPTPKAG